MLLATSEAAEKQAYLNLCLQQLLCVCLWQALWSSLEDNALWHALSLSIRQ